MNTDFENIILKKLTHSSEYFGKSMPILSHEYFMSIGNQELFKLIKEYYGSYKQTPSLTELVAKVKSVSNVEIRAEIVKSLQAIAATEEVKNVDFMLDETLTWAKDALYYKALQVGSDGLMNKDDELKAKAQQIMEQRSKLSIDSDLGLDFDDINQMIEYYAERNIGIKSQHKEFNKRLGGGFLPGTLSLIMAAAGVGKSLLMTDLISGMLVDNKNILLLSLEMSDKEIMKRVHANAMDLPINSLVDLSKTDAELKELDRPVIDKAQVLSAYNKLKTDGNCGKFFVKDYPAGSLSPLMIEQIVESYKIEQDIEFDIVFIDYLGIMKSDLVTPNAGLYSYIKSIGEETRSVAKKINKAIVSASQLNRGAISGDVDDADNSNVSDSMGSVMTADFIMFLLQNEEMKEKKEIIAKVTKNRFTGRTDTWMMNIDYEKMRFSDMLIQNSSNDINEIEPIPTQSGMGDFGLVTAEKQEKANKFANDEVKSIARSDIDYIKEADKSKKDPFDNDLDDLYAELGL
jgi:replicative DNA helicase